MAGDVLLCKRICLMGIPAVECWWWILKDLCAITSITERFCSTSHCMYFVFHNSITKLLLSVSAYYLGVSFARKIWSTHQRRAINMEADDLTTNKDSYTHDQSTQQQVAFDFWVLAHPMSSDVQWIEDWSNIFNCSIVSLEQKNDLSLHEWRTLIISACSHLPIKLPAS